MILKNKNKTPYPNAFTFYYKHPETGETVRVPEKRQASGLSQLSTLVRNAFKANKIPVPSDLQEIIEHQICIRYPKPLSICYNGGVGDRLHHQLAKPVLNAIALKAGKHRATAPLAKAAKKLSGCSGCGGTRVYRSGKNNLGRAGILNKVGKKFALNADKR